jgi:eukaryotic-like serine/threonine-protein kinase
VATRRELPADVASALDRVPEARDRFAALPAERQAEWLDWIDDAGGRQDRADRVDELIRRLVPSAAEEEEVVERRGPPFGRYWWLWLLLLLLLVVGGLLAWYFLSRGDDKATVPNVIGLQSDAAAQRIDDEGLDSLPRTGPSNRPQGVVFAQKPGAGTQLDEGQTVTISISGGAQQVSVPSVVGQTQGAAVTALTDAGLKPVLQNVSSSKPAGRVVAQNPASGTQVGKGSEVNLNVSTGTGGGATTQSTTTATTSATTTSTTPTTTTTATTPSAASVSVPDVVGQPEIPALRRLNTLGLRPTVAYTDSSEAANTVVSQSPAAGGTLKRGSRVQVRVSSGPNPQPAAAVPDVTGQDQASATSSLRSAGFRVVVFSRSASGQSDVGKVVEQQPQSGANIPGGSLVALFVGR